MKIHKVKYKDIEEIPKISVKKKFKENFFGSSPAPFIGRFGYPHVNIGVLSPQIGGDTSYYASPRTWAEHNFAIGEVATLRYGMVNSRRKGNVKKLQGRFLEIAQEVGMAKTASELEINLKGKPRLNLKPEREVMPFGPVSDILRARVTANTKVDSRVDRVVGDTDLKAGLAIWNLYKKGFEEAALSKLLSVGNVGVGKDRKLVPTRWSITAVDDTVGKELIKEVRDLQVGGFRAYFGGGWGNYYLILFFPDVWSYELFETYLDKKVNPWSKKGYAYSTDYENVYGRKNYASETAGGYYAARLSCAEKLQKIKRQGAVLALRFITPEYNVPLGVFVCREAARKALASKPVQFGSRDLMLKYAKEFIQKKFGFKLELLLKESKLLEGLKQKKLTEFP